MRFRHRAAFRLRDKFREKKQLRGTDMPPMLRKPHAQRPHKRVVTWMSGNRALTSGSQDPVWPPQYAVPAARARVLTHMNLQDVEEAKNFPPQAPRKAQESH